MPRPSERSSRNCVQDCKMSFIDSRNVLLCFTVGSSTRHQPNSKSVTGSRSRSQVGGIATLRAVHALISYRGPGSPPLPLVYILLLYLSSHNFVDTQRLLRAVDLGGRTSQTIVTWITIPDDLVTVIVHTEPVREPTTTPFDCPSKASHRYVTICLVRWRNTREKYIV